MIRILNGVSLLGSASCTHRELEDVLAMVQSGELYGTVEQFPGEQARTGLRTLVENIRNGTEPAEHDIYITPKLITADNLDEAERIAEIQ